MSMVKHAMLMMGVACMSGLASAEPPSLMNYQGRLVNGTNLVNQPVALELRLYDAAEGGSLLYADSNRVSVVDGLYSTLMGDETIHGSLTGALQGAAVYVEVVVDGQVLSPRERLVSVAYALNSVQSPQGDAWSSNQVVTLNSYTNEVIWKDGRVTWSGPDNHGGNIITNAMLYGGVVAPTATVSVLQATDSFSLSTPVWDDVTVPLLTTKNSGTFNAPVLTKMSAIAGEIYQFAFQDVGLAANEQEAIFSLQMPHAYKKGTDLYPHLHYIPADTNVTGNVVWGLEFVAGPLTGMMPSASTTYFMTNAIEATATPRMIIAGWGAIPGTGVKESSCIFGRVFRASSQAADTYDADVFGISFDLHYEVNSLGSKNQIP